MKPLERKMATRDAEHASPADLQRQFEALLQERERDPELLAANRAVDEVHQLQNEHKRCFDQAAERLRRARLRIVAPLSLDIVDRLERELAQVVDAQKVAPKSERRRLEDSIVNTSRALNAERRVLDRAGQPGKTQILAAPPEVREEWRTAAAAFDDARRPVFPSFEERLSDAKKAQRAAQQRAADRVAPRLMAIYAKMVHLQAAAGRPLNDASSRVHAMATRLNALYQQPAGLRRVEDLSFPFFRQNPAFADGRTMFDTWLQNYAAGLPDGE